MHMTNGGWQQEVGEIRKLPRIAAIATMASRRETFERVLPVIRAQVHHVFVYLDGYDDVPTFLRDMDRVTVRHAEEVGNLHCSSRWLCLRELSAPAVVAVVDDDIAYPPNYVAVLAEVLQHFQGNAMVGVHGRIFLPPHGSYVRDAQPLHFVTRQERAQQVHELGTGTCAFLSSRLPIDPANWPRNDMDDILVAIEAQRLGLPRIAVPRPEGWLKPHAECQADSLWVRTRSDDSTQSMLMRKLLALYDQRAPAASPAIRSRAVPRQVPTPG